MAMSSNDDPGTSQEKGGRRGSASSIRASKVIAVDGPALPGEIHGWYAYDFSFSPYWQVADVTMNWYLKRLADYAILEGSYPKFLGDAKAFPGWVVLMTTLVQVLCLLSFSAFGDYGSHRKMLLKCCTWGASLFLFLCVFCSSGSMWWFAALMRVLMGVCFVLTNVFYNAYLPLLTSQHPDVLALEGEAAEKRELELSAQISARGFACGYTGGMTMQVIAFLLFSTFECKKQPCSEHDRLFWFGLIISFCGVWWACFSLYSFASLKERAGGPFPEGASPLCLGWQQTRETLGIVAGLRNTWIYVLGYFIWSDALTTFQKISVLYLEEVTEGSTNSTTNPTNSTSHAIVLATTAIRMLSTNSSDIDPAQTSAEFNLDSGRWILLIGATLAMLLGVFLFTSIQNALRASSKAVLMSMLSLFAIISLACALGGLQNYYFFCMIPMTLMSGAQQAYQRSLFSNLAPVGKEAAMFSFYTITDKGSSVIGAIVIIAVSGSTGSYIGVFWYCLIAFASSTVILSFVDMQQGMREAGKSEDLSQQSMELVDKS